MSTSGDSTVALFFAVDVSRPSAERSIFLLSTRSFLPFFVLLRINGIIFYSIMYLLTGSYAPIRIVERKVEPATKKLLPF